MGPSKADDGPMFDAIVVGFDGSRPADLSAFDREAILRTGAAVHLAPARAGDEDPIAEFYRRLDDSSNFNRFFGIRRDIPFPELHELTAAPPTRCVAVLAWIDGEVAGIGEFHATDEPDEAEVAFAVVAAHQHEGIATLLLEDLAVIAEHIGFLRLIAVTLPSNGAMQLVFRTAGLSEQHQLANGEVSYAMDLSSLAGLRAGAEARAATAGSGARPRPLDQEASGAGADLVPLR
jgi:GNAT superfamily N-acetyltransferase